MITIRIAVATARAIQKGTRTLGGPPWMRSRSGMKLIAGKPPIALSLATAVPHEQADIRHLGTRSKLSVWFGQLPSHRPNVFATAGLAEGVFDVFAAVQLAEEDNAIQLWPPPSDGGHHPSQDPQQLTGRTAGTVENGNAGRVMHEPVLYLGHLEAIICPLNHGRVGEAHGSGQGQRAGLKHGHLT